MESLDDRMKNRPWMVSMHGGHSSDFCDHAEGSLREMLDAAIAAGYHTFGVSEHAPRCEDRFMYPNERKLGWTLEKTMLDFDRYIQLIPKLTAEYAGRLNVVRGFECEVVPTSSYIARTRAYRATALPSGSGELFNFFVGSVHFVGEIPIDAEPEQWAEASEAHGGPESLAVAYYSAIEKLVTALQPDVVGHLDLIKLNVERAGFEPSSLLTPNVITAVDHALEAIRASNGILDLNTAAWRKGLAEPYPAPWLVSKASAMGISFCFGDDSHRPGQVGFGIERARKYLLENGVQTVTFVNANSERIRYPLN